MNSPTEAEKRSGLVVLIDALGTKQKAADETWPKLMQRWMAVIREARGVKTFEYQDYPSGESSGKLAPIVVEQEVFAFSDTALLTYSTGPGGSNAKLLSLCYPRLRHLFVTSLRQKIPIRGAASVGDFYIGEGVCIGTAVANAAAWFDKADWAGIVLAPETGELWKDHWGFAWDSASNLAFRWNEVGLPRSARQGESHPERLPPMLALSWPTQPSLIGVTREELRTITWQAFEGLYEREAAERKMRATLEFFDDSCKMEDLARASPLEHPKPRVDNSASRIVTRGE